MAGEVLYHSLVKKTKSQVKEQKKKRKEKILLKLSRRKH